MSKNLQKDNSKLSDYEPDGLHHNKPHKCKYPKCPYPCPDLPDCRDAEQPAQPQEPVAYAVYHRIGGSKTLHWPEQHSEDGDHNEYRLVPLYEHPPAQQQEPVAWRNAALRVGEDLCSVGPFGYYDMTAEQWLDWALSVVTVHAPPASKPWVGLTEGEANKIYKDGSTFGEMMRMVEAKLKEKNA